MDGMLAESSARTVTRMWLDAFGTALQTGDAAALGGLFVAESHWRDILAFDWDLRTTSGAAAIGARLAALTVLGAAVAAVDVATAAVVLTKSEDGSGQTHSSGCHVLLCSAVQHCVVQYCTVLRSAQLAQGSNWARAGVPSPVAARG
jgi:hypothetical protein